MKLVVEALLERDQIGFFGTSTEAQASSEWQEYVAPMALRLTIMPGVPLHLGTIRSSIKQLRFLRSTISRSRADHVFILNGDGLTQIASLCRRILYRYQKGEGPDGGSCPSSSLCVSGFRSASEGEAVAFEVVG